MHGPDPSWCARMHTRPAQEASASPSPPAEERPVDAVPERFGARSDDSPRRLFTPRQIPTVHECELCGTVMYDHNCKILCPNCGYKRDCSDP